MKNLKQKFEANYLLGCIKYNGIYEIYLMPIAWWILNYKKYDPEYDPAAWQSIFRDNVLNVTDNKIVQFFNSIADDKITLNELKRVVNDISLEYREIYFFVDFDDKIFINAFCDISVEEYLPDTSWKGEFGNPIDYLPEELRNSW